VLHLSATPIPRTLALTSYGDLEVSELRELPAGRRPVETRVVSEADRTGVFRALRDDLDRGHQAFVVCPLVEESADLGAKAAEAEAERLLEGELAGYEVGLIHGRMPAERKEAAMAGFESGKTDVLVATSVIEVGIDVPNATTIVIEGAERFGVAQLHQLRGRVGRGPAGGTCWLMAGSASASARRRLAAIASEPDGFRLAEFDLASRGEGELSGRRQHGLPRFRVARLPVDSAILEAAREDVEYLARLEGGLASPGLGPLLDVAASRFGPAGVLAPERPAESGKAA
jgi:ATP-dependent DNA helicase RecG